MPDNRDKVPTFLTQSREAVRAGTLRGLTPREGLVLMALNVGWSDRDGVAFPGAANLTWATGMEQKTLQRAIAGLIRKGRLYVLKKPAAGRATTYRLMLTPDTQCPPIMPSTPDIACPPQRADGGHFSPSRGTPARPTVDKIDGTPDSACPPNGSSNGMNGTPPTVCTGGGWKNTDEGLDVNDFIGRIMRALNIAPADVARNYLKVQIVATAIAKRDDWRQVAERAVAMAEANYVSRYSNAPVRNPFANWLGTMRESLGLIRRVSEAKA